MANRGKNALAYRGPATLSTKPYIPLIMDSTKFCRPLGGLSALIFTRSKVEEEYQHGACYQRGKDGVGQQESVGQLVKLLRLMGIRFQYGLRRKVDFRSGKERLLRPLLQTERFLWLLL